MNLPDTLPGHWETAEGLDKAREYATKVRADLALANRSDLGLANALYLVDGEIVIQTAAKERMRWLSVQLALRDLEIAALKEGAPEKVRIGVTMNGGLVQSIWSDMALPHVEVVVIDYDVEGTTEDVVEVRQTDGPDPAWALALVSVQTPDVVTNNNWADDFRDPETEEVVDIFGGALTAAEENGDDA